jgi:hypothetical protein
MRKLAALVLVAWVSTAHASLEEDGIWKAGAWATTTWADGVWLEGEASTVAVPNVVGEANFAAADAILEGDGLDGAESAACVFDLMEYPEDEVIRQSPIAGTMVSLGSIVIVTVSDGTACELSGRPGIRVPGGLRVPGL